MLPSCWASMMIVMFPAMPGVPTGHWTLDIVQVWGFWGSVPGDLPSSQPTILGFNEPDHKDQVWWNRSGEAPTRPT